ncbi:MAG: hypothetical protein AB8B69_07745 [Chitinophagales bacterium]
MKQKLRLFLFLSLSIWSFSTSFAFEGMESYLQQNEALNQEDFLKTFPFEAYFELTPINDYQTLEQDRQLLNENERAGDKFIEVLGKKYLETKPIDLTNFKQTKNKIEVGWLYLYALPQLIPKHHMSFDILGDHLLSQIAEQVEKQIKDGKLETDNWQTRFYVQRLQDCSYFIDIPKSNVSKLLFHVQNHNWAYIWSRVRSRYLTEFILILLLPLALFALYFRKRKMRMEIERQ